MGDLRFDSRGCLTAAGLAALRKAATGAAPAELAQHLATCVRCQDRWLATERRSATGERKAAAPHLRRTLLIFGAAALLALLALAATLAWLSR